MKPWFRQYAYISEYKTRPSATDIGGFHNETHLDINVEVAVLNNIQIVSKSS